MKKKILSVLCVLVMCLGCELFSGDEDIKYDEYTITGNENITYLAIDTETKEVYIKLTIEGNHNRTFLIQDAANGQVIAEIVEAEQAVEYLKANKLS